MLTERQIEERRKTIGGSDSPVVLGLSPFKTRRELYLEKKGLAPDIIETKAMQRGTYLEPIVANLYEKETGRTVAIHPDSLRHPTIACMSANIDRAILNDARGLGVIEIKCPGLKVFTKCKREGLPSHYITQLQHYLSFPKFKWGAFVIFSAELWEMIHFDVEPDNEIIDIIQAKDTEFWQMLEAGIEPEEEAGPVIDLPSTGGELIRIETEEWRKAAQELQEAIEIRTEAEALEEDAKERIKTLMGSHGVAEGFNLRCYNKWQAGRKTFDKKLLAFEHPEIELAKYEKQGKDFQTFKTYFLKEKTYE